MKGAHFPVFEGYIWTESHRTMRGILTEGETGERLLGVLTSLRLKVTNFDLFFTTKRIIAARASSALTGVLAFGVAGLALTPGKPEKRLGDYAEMNLDQIASAHRKNFEIPLSAVERAAFDGGRANVTLPVVRIWASGKKMRFLFTQSMWRRDRAQISHAKELLALALGKRVSFKRV